MKTAGTLSTDARAWRALGRFWAVVLAAAVLGAAALAWLGPPETVPVPGSLESPRVAAGGTGPTPEDAGATADMPAATREDAAEDRASARAAAAEAAAQVPPEMEMPAEARPVASVPPVATMPDPPPTQQAAAMALPLPPVVGPAATPPAAPLTPPGAPPLAPHQPASQPASPRTAALAAPFLPERPAAAPLGVATPPAALPPPAEITPGPIPPPDPGLTEASRHGPLPRIGPDGRSPARLYARAFDRSQPGPRVAVLVGGVGMSARLAEEAIARLPPEVSLALSPYAPNPGPILAAARARGIETLMSLPFEPQGWPLNDPGDQALLTGLPMEQNLDRLFWALSRAQGQIGAVGALGPLRGERFAAQPGALEAVQRILASRGLAYVEPRPGAAGPAFAWGVAVDLVLDEPPGAAAIDARLAALEARARERGTAIGYAGDPSPVLVARIAAWAEGLARRGVVLAPVSAMIRRPEPR
ncbi:MAG: divergent polysaccharide deacetylase family protein [Acetobacteraceae bacterium]